VIALLDMDAFYVAVELLRRPELRGKPVVVAGRGPRAVVTTASYEARRFGVGSAVPAARARRLCPEGIFLPPDFNHYRAKSREVMALVGGLGVPTEAVSLDEVYLDLSALAYPIDEMSRLVRRIKADLELDASVGIGPNKLVAKVASEAEKPRGFVVLTREQAAARFAGEAVTLLPGIGPKTADSLRALGVSSIGDLQRLPLERLQERFGERQGRYLHDRAHFRDHSEVAVREVKSRSVEATFDRDLSGIEAMERVLDGQAGELARSLRARGIRGRTVSIKVRLDDFTTVTRARTLAEATDDPATIADIARALIRAYDPPRPVRLLGVRAASFEDASGSARGQAPPLAGWANGPPGPQSSSATTSSLIAPG
jgi:DNA polymerase IV